MAKAVVLRALAFVGEHRVRLARFLEPLFRFWIVGIAVRMELQRELPVSALDLRLVRLTGDTKNLVIIAFHVGRQGISPGLSLGIARDADHGWTQQTLF